jgi:LPXTG-site transpeptidase (sortase) family protein
MLDQMHSSARRAATRATHPPAQLPPLRARITWTFGTLFMMIGLYLLLYVGGIYLQIEYYREAARGDSTTPAPQIVTQAVTVTSPDLEGGSQQAVPAFTAPVLEGGTAGQIVSAAPDEATGGPSTVTRIEIPSIDVDAKTIEVGWDIVQEDGREVAVWQVAEYAVGHHRGSANPGEGGNVVLAGHVGGYGKVFRDLYYVQPGDRVVLHSEGQQYLYVVQEHLVLQEVGVPLEQRAENARYIQATDHEVVTLVTCWPDHGPERFHYRVIVRAVPYGSTTSDGPQGETWTIR